MKSRIVISAFIIISCINNKITDQKSGKRQSQLNKLCLLDVSRRCRSPLDSIEMFDSIDDMSRIVNNGRVNRTVGALTGGAGTAAEELFNPH